MSGPGATLIAPCLIRGLTLAVVVAAAFPVAVLRPLADDRRDVCGCGCGRTVGSCCCAAPHGSELALLCRDDADEAEAKSTLWPAAIHRAGAPFPTPVDERRAVTPRSGRRFEVDLEPEPPIPKRVGRG